MTNQNIFKDMTYAVPRQVGFTVTVEVFTSKDKECIQEQIEAGRLGFAENIFTDENL